MTIKSCARKSITARARIVGALLAPTLLLSATQASADRNTVASAQSGDDPLSDTSAASDSTQQAKQEQEATKRSRTLTIRIRSLRRQTWYWQHVISVRPRLYPARVPSQSAHASDALAFADLKQRVTDVWAKRLRALSRVGHNPPNYRSWLCVHGGEGGWTSATGNGYYGGLQMDRTFMRTYAPWLLTVKGTANHWTPLEQIWVAERGRRVQGWRAWPATSRSCGLS